MIRPERVWPRIAARADMDAFYAAIGQLDDASSEWNPFEGAYRKSEVDGGTDAHWICALTGFIRATDAVPVLPPA